ncbi:MAG: UDP-N-acetylmuramoyl-L-alanine--D-glutamate ligase [Clostridia bacterium]|nr:UDP-N-acetylmuramoyl-L-alanine--D-glutamate ligase [Clostridia bacterium]
MIDFQNRTVCLLGAGVSNMPLAEYLLSLGADLTIRDKKPFDQLGEKAAALAGCGVRFITGDDYLEDITESVVFRSPGFRPDIPELAGAVSRGALLTSEMELFLDNASCPVFAVTGSDGKSTTTTITHLLLSAGLEGTGHTAFLGGNIGQPLAHRLPLIHAEDKVAVELSSFQLMTIDAPMEAAAITNITPNHLNWHPDMEEYIAAKVRILRQAKRAVLNYGDENTRKIGEACTIPVTWFSRYPIDPASLREGDSAITIEDGFITAYWAGEGREVIMSVTDIRLPGLHNAENYMTAIALTHGHVTTEQIRQVAMTFGGVEHRLESVETIDGVHFINGSIDSSPTRTAAALSALGERPIVLICGGYDKQIPFAPLADAVLSRRNVHTLVLTGATGDAIEAAMRECPLWEDRVNEGFMLFREPVFDDAVRCAANAAKAGDTVLLSPACASFDAFPNFEARGRHFKALVREMKK